MIASRIWFVGLALIVDLVQVCSCFAQEATRSSKTCVSIHSKHDPRGCVVAGSGDSFQDCPECPKMVVAPAGRYVMGSPKAEEWRALGERQFRITVARPFAIGRQAVSFAEWDACVSGGGCNGYRPEDGGWGRGQQPVINVNWDDAQSYLKWLSTKTGHTYRLPSEAEREYVTRAGTSTKYWWGSQFAPENGNVEIPTPLNRNNLASTTVSAAYRPLSVDSFAANRWGLFNVHGNVWEWTLDCWIAQPEKRPRGVAAVTIGDCGARVARGGSWKDYPSEARAATRFGFNAHSRNDVQGFRVVRNL